MSHSESYSRCQPYIKRKTLQSHNRTQRKMLCNQWLEWEIISGKLYIHFWSPCWLLWAPSQWSGPVDVKYKNASCYTLSSYSCKFVRNKLKTKEINIIGRHLKCNVICIKNQLPVEYRISQTSQIAHSAEIRRWLKLTHKVCRTMTKINYSNHFFAS